MHNQLKSKNAGAASDTARRATPIQPTGYRSSSFSAPASKNHNVSNINASGKDDISANLQRKIREADANEAEARFEGDEYWSHSKKGL
jgi:hypothetical protein